MLQFISIPTSIGLERTSTALKGAKIVIQGKRSSINQLFKLHPDTDDVKQLYIQHPILTTGLEGKEVLIRPLHLPLTKEKDIETALAFQVEPLLPYPIDEALLTYQVNAKTAEGTQLIYLAARKEAVQTHLDAWQTLELEPEKIACVPFALCQFGASYLSSHKTFLILHLQSQLMTCVLIQDGKLQASFTQPEGLELLFKAQTLDEKDSLPQNAFEWQTLEQQPQSHIKEALKRLQKEVVKMSYALAKELKEGSLEGIMVTGEGAEWEGFSQILVQSLSLPLLTCDQQAQHTPQELQSYAVPIGLALSSLPNQPHNVDFRQKECSYPHPWRRLLGGLALYFLAIFFLSFSFYFFGQQYLHYKEDQLRQTYMDLLAGMHKSHAQFETAFLAKYPKAHEAFQGEVPQIKQLKQEDLMERLAFLQKELQSTPDSFPLLANTPRVSDVFAWLSQHPTVAFIDGEGKKQTKLQIDNFSYMMLKRPQHGKKQEKYQIKIELEFSSPTPKWAREFHDALITPNEWVDPKGEVKWSSNRGKYKTSFFLKDKTVYPSS